MAQDDDDGGNGGNGGNGGGGGGDRTVAYSTYRKVVDAKSGLEAQVAELKGQVDSLTEKAATADTLGQELASWKTKATDAEQRFGRYQSIAGAIQSTDPDAIEAVEWQYGKLGNDRPELAAWLQQLTAEPDKAPSVLRPFLPKSGTGGAGGAAGGSGGAGGSTGGAPPRKGNPGPTGTGGGYTEEEVAEIARKARETGDFSLYRQVRKSWMPDS